MKSLGVVVTSELKVNSLYCIGVTAGLAENDQNPKKKLYTAYKKVAIFRFGNGVRGGIRLHGRLLYLLQ